MKIIWQAIKDWWVVVLAFGGALSTAYKIVSQLKAFGVIKPDVQFAVSLIFFLLFGSIAILKAVKKSREKIKSNDNDEQNIGVQSKNQHGGLTAHTININTIPSQRIENISKEVNLTITPQEKTLDGNSYIIISITNNETDAIFCWVEIRGVFNNNNKNIKREISQYANIFSWSGGSQNGTKEIPAGLDGTVNLIVRRTNAYGFYFLFHENPDTNWKNAGIYMLDLVVKGTIGNTDFVEKRVTINFEYIEQEEHDSFGQFFNRGILILLEMKIEEGKDIDISHYKYPWSRHDLGQMGVAPTDNDTFRIGLQVTNNSNVSMRNCTLRFISFEYIGRESKNDWVSDIPPVDTRLFDWDEGYSIPNGKIDRISSNGGFAILRFAESHHHSPDFRFSFIDGMSETSLMFEGRYRVCIRLDAQTQKGNLTDFSKYYLVEFHFQRRQFSNVSISLKTATHRNVPGRSAT